MFLKLIDNFLNRITMYRLVLYELIVLLGGGMVAAFLGKVRFTPWEILFSTLFLIVVSWIINKIFAWAFDVPDNFESLYITAMILALIINPATTFSGYAFLFWAAALAMAVKFILAYRRKHIFNPAAVAVVITALALGQTTTWWVGTVWLLPLVIIGGVLVVRKIQRFDMIFAFLAATLATSFILSVVNGRDAGKVLQEALIHSPLFFFATVMLTEPLTTPPTKNLQIVYGILTGILFSPQFHLGGFFTTPELALVLANVFSFAVSPKRKLLLRLKEKNQLAPDILELVFTPRSNFAFAPGQYLEWTLRLPKIDSRGNRRCFTIASAPTEKDLRIGVKFYQNSSMFKRSLWHMKTGQEILAGQLGGDFTLPRRKEEKLVFVAGGIGATPFRSMIKYLLDKNEHRSIVVLYSNPNDDEIAYKQIFDQAEERLGIKTIYALTQQDRMPDFRAHLGRITPELIAREIPDYHERTFYISGSHRMVSGFEQMLAGMGIKKSRLKTDYFPGLS